jgi:hypothetical protein
MGTWIGCALICAELIELPPVYVGCIDLCILIALNMSAQITPDRSPVRSFSA